MTRLAILLGAALVFPSAACGGEGDSRPGVRILLEADTSTLSSGTDIDEALNSAKGIIERRINSFGISDAEVAREEKNRVSVRLPGIALDQARSLVGSTGLLEFREPVRNDQGEIACWAADGSQFGVTPLQVQSGRNDKGLLTSQCFGSANETGVLAWTPATGVINKETWPLTGRFIKPNAKAILDPSRGPTVQLEMTGEGSQILEQVTTRLVNYPLGIFLDDVLISAPTVQQAITGGQTVITGLTLDEVKTLAVQINAGALPVPLKVISVEQTGP